MKNRTIIIAFFAFAALVVATSCKKNLDLFPPNDMTTEQVYATPDGYMQVLAKVYGGLSMTGNQGPSGKPDIAGGLDEGSQVPFIRGFFNLQELPTDEAVVAWTDQTIHDFHYLRWTSSDVFIKGAYARPIYNITLINEYLRELPTMRPQSCARRMRECRAKAAPRSTTWCTREAWRASRSRSISLRL